MKRFRFAAPALLLLLTFALHGCGSADKAEPAIPAGARLMQLPNGISCLLPPGWKALEPASAQLDADPVVAGKYDAQGQMLAALAVRDMATRASFGAQELKAMSEAERNTLLRKTSAAARSIFSDQGDVLSVVVRLREINALYSIMTTVEYIPNDNNPYNFSTTVVRSELLLDKRYVSVTVSYASRLQSLQMDQDIEMILGSFNPGQAN